MTICPVCGKDCGIAISFANLCQSLPCASCGAMLEVCYDETWEDGEEVSHFWIEEDKS